VGVHGRSSACSMCHQGSRHLAVMQVVPELSSIANLDLKVAFNVDSSRVGPGGL
jgi:hypothetical protein